MRLLHPNRTIGLPQTPSALMRDPALMALGISFKLVCGCVFVLSQVLLPYSRSCCFPCIWGRERWRWIPGHIAPDRCRIWYSAFLLSVLHRQRNQNHRCFSSWCVLLVHEVHLCVGIHFVCAECRTGARPRTYVLSTHLTSPTSSLMRKQHSEPESDIHQEFFELFYGVFRRKRPCFF